MTRILMPVISRRSSNPILGGSKVLGGIYRFQELVHQNIPNVFPVYVTMDIIKSRKVDQFIAVEAEKHNVDLIFWNQAKSYAIRQINLGLPVVILNHEPSNATRPMMKNYGRMLRFTDNGGKLFFVSNDQHIKSNKHALRLEGRTIDNVAGYIPSAFADSTAIVSEASLYDTVTIGRSDPSKNPFWLHSSLKNSSLTSCVLTIDGITNSENENLYVDKNNHWCDPRYTYRNLNHSDTLNLMSKCKVYVSTWAEESWGITALEALTYGLPLVIRSDSSGTHASTHIPDNQSDYRMISNKTELEKSILELKDLSFKERLDISERTKLKHSRENWVKQVSRMFDLSNTNKRKTLFD